MEVNNNLCQKLKLTGKSKLNHLTIILTFPYKCEPKLPLNKWAPKHEMLKYYIRGKVTTRFEHKTTYDKPQLLPKA